MDSQTSGSESDAGGAPPFAARLQRTTQERFEALALWGDTAGFRVRRVPASWWAADREQLLALIHTGSGRFAVVITLMMRDSSDRYRPISHSPNFPTVGFPEHAISGPLGAEARTKVFETKTDGPPRGVALFAPLIPEDRIAPEFRYLRDGMNQSAAREVLQKLQP